MNETAPVRETHALHQDATTDRFERAFRLYRRRVGRCRTENQSNRLHIALDNYMTPAEVRYFAAALAQDAADSLSRRWITTLVGSMPIKKVRSVEFERTELRKGVSLYSTNDGSRNHKTLVIGIAGLHHRLMAPTSYILDCLNPALYDVIILRDFSGRAFAFGIPGLGGDFFEALSGLRALVDPRAYRNALSLGTSSGGLPAVMAAILLGLNRGISICGEDLGWFAARVKSQGGDDARYLTLLASRPQPYPELVLVCGEKKMDDAAAAVVLHNLVPSELWKVRNCAQHGILKWYMSRGTLPAFLAKILGQSLESRDLASVRLTTARTSIAGSGSRERLL